MLTWWMWICLGVLLLLAEAMTPGGFYLLFIGLSALLVGALKPLLPAAWMQVLLFGILSAALIAFFRKPLVVRLKASTPAADAPELLGETARALNAMAPGAEGRVELRGSTWKARNMGDRGLPQGAPCRVVSRDGLGVAVRPLD